MDLVDVSPPIVENGVDGTQKVGDPADIQESPAPLEGQFLPRTMVGLAADLPGKFGGIVSAPILSAMIKDLSAERDSLKAQVASYQDQIGKVTQDLHNERIARAKLEVRLSESEKSNIIQKLCTFFSPVLVSIAIDLWKANLNSAVPLGLIGIALLLVNFVPKRGKE
ncbi:hypothetical protein [Pseudomonas yamanorum]|uniref:hypothetical protein n=1 Tax=Pseudomonas yamanorum TaxID=515393 RepID=UPI0007A4B70D|nr:hypothetical protein [Pseudomonas yamanorum]